jgi:hypothetical protein
MLSMIWLSSLTESSSGITKPKFNGKPLAQILESYYTFVVLSLSLQENFNTKASCLFNSLFFFTKNLGAAI